jgi:hypothetical protein
MNNKNDFVSDKRLYLDKDGNVVGDKDPNKFKLLVNVGGSLSAEDAAKYGLGQEGTEEDATEEATDEEEGEGEENSSTAKSPTAKPKAKAPARKK